MTRASLRLIFCLVFAALFALALPAVAPAFQTVRIDVAFDGSKTIVITGDQGKTSDLVTVSYDPATHEYVITHDINMTSPPTGCHLVGSGPPYKELRCPASLVTDINIDVGEDNDSVVIDGLLDPTGLGGVYLPPELQLVSVNLGPGNDSFSGSPWASAYSMLATASVTGHPAVNSIDTGPGVDKVSLEGGTNTVTFGGSGKFTSAGGTNTVTFGPGNSKFTGGSGVDVATFGPGNSSFTGNGGNDSAKFGAGNDTFSGGGGKDTAKMGAGNDNASGGPGNDKLIGGPGNDHLFGNAGFDVLKGGGGHADKCAAGGGGAKTVGCEKP